MAVKVIKPGLSTTVQDLGRPGYYNIGIPLSGGMDRLALKAANLLVGNKEGAAVLEGDRVVELVAGGVTVDLEAPVSGRLVAQLVDEDASVAAGTVIAEFVAAE